MKGWIMWGYWPNYLSQTTLNSGLTNLIKRLAQGFFLELLVLKGGFK
jgi:hypothetical protein